MRLPPRAAPLAALLLLLMPLRPRAAQAPAPVATGGDPLLERLVRESLAARPELREAEASARAERERVPQAGALPDPVLSLGIQNDGFDAIRVGEMPSSFYQVMVSQGLPWPGKRALRTEVASLSARQAELAVVRVGLTTEADVRRTYLDLVLARDRLELLDRLEGIWRKSAGIARVRYEAGEGAQSDVLRAQLEINRIRQRRWSLEAEQRTRVEALNRLRGRPLDEEIPTTASMRSLADPALPGLADAVADALARSPELALARLGVSRAEKELALARRERFPDLAVNAGVMPRGSLDPMWQAGISVSLPVWSYRKQGRAVTERAARAAADERSAEAVEQVLQLRVAERHAQLEALLDTLRLYRQGLLVQSEATADSTLAQYRVGRVTFASVLEANAGYINDEEGYLLAVADAHRVGIASAEVSLDPIGVSAAGGGGMGAAGMPGAGSTAGARGGSAGGAAASAAQGSSAAMPAGM